MSQDKIYIYVNPSEDIDTFPDNLLGDMTVCGGYRTEVQWLFFLMLKEKIKNIRFLFRTNL